jgi:hypothetical protein
VAKNLEKNDEGEVGKRFFAINWKKKNARGDGSKWRRCKGLVRWAVVWYSDEIKNRIEKIRKKMNGAKKTVIQKDGNQMKNT